MCSITIRLLVLFYNFVFWYINEVCTYVTKQKTMPGFKRSRTGIPFKSSSSKRRKRLDDGDVSRSQVTNSVSTAVIPRYRLKSIPRQVYVTLRYYETFSLNPVSGGIAVNVFRANSCYDPNLTGSGHQPAGFDQYIAMYKHGVCLSSKITVKALNTGLTAADLCVFGVTLRPASSTEVATVRYVEHDQTAFAAGGVGEANQEVVNTIDCPKQFGVTNIADDDYARFSASSDCTRLSYYHVWCGSVQSGDDPAAFNMTALIEYKVKFVEPRDVEVE